MYAHLSARLTAPRRCIAAGKLQAGSRAHSRAVERALAAAQAAGEQVEELGTQALTQEDIDAADATAISDEVS